MRYPYEQVDNGMGPETRRKINDNFKDIESDIIEVNQRVTSNDDTITKRVDDLDTQTNTRMDEIEKEVVEVNNKSVHFDGVDAELAEHSDLLEQLKASSIDGEIIAARNGFPSLLDFLKTLDKGSTIATKILSPTAGQTVIDLTDTGELQAAGKIIMFLIDGSPQFDSYTWTSPTKLTMKSPFAGTEKVVIRYFVGNAAIRTGHNRSHEKGGFDEIDATRLLNGDILTVTLGLGILGERYPRLSNETDDAPRMNRMIADAIDKNIGKIKLAAIDYFIKSQTVDMSAASGLAWEGVSYDNKGNGSVIEGTRIIRQANIIALKAIGTSVSVNGGVNIRGFRFNKIRFMGGDYAEDFAQFKACAVTYINDCMFSAMTGRQLLLQEVMDSRITDNIFEWGGSTDGTLPCVELISGGGYEYTNQIHFTGNRFESYRGTALVLSGVNTNEIYMSNNKMESLITMQPSIVLNDANAINLGVLNICTKGTVGQTLSSQVVINNTDGVYGLLWLEHTGTIDTSSSKIDKFVEIKGTSSDIDLLVYVYQNGANTVQSSPVMVTASDTDTININGTIRGSLKAICNIHARMRNIQIKNTTPSFRMNYSVVTAWSEYWEVRVNGDGTGSKYTLSHNKDGTLTDIFSVLNSGDTHFYKNVFFNNYAMHLSQLSATPYGRNGSMYYDSTTNSIKAYVNGSWKTISVT